MDKADNLEGKKKRLAEKYHSKNNKETVMSIWNNEKSENCSHLSGPELDVM